MSDVIVSPVCLTCMSHLHVLLACLTCTSHLCVSPEVNDDVTGWLWWRKLECWGDQRQQNVVDSGVRNERQTDRGLHRLNCVSLYVCWYAVTLFVFDLFTGGRVTDDVWYSAHTLLTIIPSSCLWNEPLFVLNLNQPTSPLCKGWNSFIQRTFSSGNDQSTMSLACNFSHVFPNVCLCLIKVWRYCYRFITAYGSYCRYKTTKFAISQPLNNDFYVKRVLEITKCFVEVWCSMNFTIAVYAVF